jgi:hypothetical protein
VSRLTLRDVMKLPPAVRDAVLAQIREKGPLTATKRDAADTGPRFDSQRERDFAAYLELVGLRWEHHAVRLKIARGRKPAFYTPDFLVQPGTHPAYLGGKLVLEPVLVEVKGFWREAARVRIKVAAGLYEMFRFVAVTRVKGEWQFEWF